MLEPSEDDYPEREVDSPVSSSSSTGYVYEMDVTLLPEDEERVSQAGLAYGWLGWKPMWLQRFNTSNNFVIWGAMAVFLQGALCTGMGNSVLTTIERRFGFKTTQVALFGTCYHIVAGLSGPFVGYFGHRHRPRVIALGCIALFLGTLVVTIPHHLSNKYAGGVKQHVDLCRVGNYSSEILQTAECSSINPSSQLYLVIIICGYCLLGLGTVPIYSMAAAHIDDVCDRSKHAFYMSTIVLAGLIGPALGFMLAKPVLSIYVDIHQPPGSALTPDKDSWLGAWWLGYLICGSLLLLPVLQLFGFSPRFPDTEQVRNTRSMQEDSIEENKRLKHDLKSLLPATKEFFKNGPLVFICLSNAAECLVLGGFATFIPKFIENQYHVSSSNSALYAGFLIIPGSVVGIALGAYLSKRFNWNCRSSIRASCVMAFIATLGTTIALVGCDSTDVAGLDRPYYNSSALLDLDNRCRGSCNCSTKYYKPICSEADHMTYFSPCHAGCKSQNETAKTYSKCSCLPQNIQFATEGRCKPSCRLFPLFSIMFTFLMIFMFMNNVPLLRAIFRVVPEGQGSFAMGFQQVFVRFFGFIPAPVLFGKLIDKSCKMWLRDECTGETKSCLEYDNAKFRSYMFALGGTCKLVGCLLLIVAYKLYKPPPSKEIFPKDDRNQRTMIHMDDITSSDSLWTTSANS